MATPDLSSASASASIDQIPVIVWEVDVATFRFLYVSAYAERLLGFPIERWYSDVEFFWNQIHPEDREPTRKACMEATRRGEDHSLEYRMLTADGRTVWLRDHVRVSPAADGRPERLVGVMVDMTEERRTQLERESIGKVSRLLIEATSIAEIYRELPRLLVRCSTFPNAIIVLGQPGDAELWCVGAAMAEGFAPEKAPGLHAPLHLAFEQTVSGEAITTRRPVVAYDIQSTRPRLDARARAMGLDTAVSVPLLSGARVMGALTFGTPERTPVEPSTLRTLEIIASLLSHQMQRHESLRALRVREQALEAVEQAVLITDQLQPGHPVVYASPSFERLLGRAPGSEILPAESVHASADPAMVAEFRAAVAADRPCRVEIDVVRGDRTPLRAAVLFAPVREEGGRVTHHVATFEDVTAQRRLEQELARAQRIEALGRLAGGIAHDFNNLLTVVVGYGDQLLKQLPDGDPLRADADEIRKAGERGARLTRQLLAFSRRQSAPAQVLDLNDVLRDMQPMFERLLREDVRLVVELAPGKALISADRGQVEQVVMNLVLNARDAMPRGGPLRLLTRRGAYGEDHTIDLAICDSGLGMDTSTRERMFDPFFTTKETGTGLGLATVYGIVTQLGGTIDIESAPEQGTVVTVRLPEAEPAASTEIAPQRAARRVGGETILLVEDDPLVRRVSRDGLERAGFRVVAASRGDEALAALNGGQQRIDLVATDIVMPGMSGIELAHRLQASRPGMRFVFMTGFADPALAARRPAGSVLLQKPFGIDDLVSAIRNSLEGPPPARAVVEGAA
jgi:PAS domain S-box-containing protein